MRRADGFRQSIRLFISAAILCVCCHEANKKEFESVPLNQAMFCGSLDWGGCVKVIFIFHQVLDTFLFLDMQGEIETAIWFYKCFDKR